MRARIHTDAHTHIIIKYFILITDVHNTDKECIEIFLESPNIIYYLCIISRIVYRLIVSLFKHLKIEFFMLTKMLRHFET